MCGDHPAGKDGGKNDHNKSRPPVDNCLTLAFTDVFTDKGDDEDEATDEDADRNGEACALE